MLQAPKLQEEYREELDELVFALQARLKPALGLVIYPDQETRHWLAGQINQRLPEYQSYPINLPKPPIQSLHGFLKDHLPPEILSAASIAHLLHIFGLDQHLDPRKPAQSLADQINFERELLFRNLPGVSLIWLGEAPAHLLRQLAPDFWDWLNYRFVFKNSVFEYKGVAQAAPIMLWGTISAEASDPYIRSLRSKLAALDTHPETQRRWREEKACAVCWPANCSRPAKRGKPFTIIR
ncbi:MAG: hypothetical protein HC880_21080 [Bacteroidia bacterium]|nr:hypothetical protein [Bacteroidia bacterium]